MQRVDSEFRLRYRVQIQTIGQSVFTVRTLALLTSNSYAKKTILKLRPQFLIFFNIIL